MLGKPIELLSMRSGYAEFDGYLTEAGAVPLRDYAPALPGTVVARQYPEACRGNIDRSVPDDDINYSVLALMLIEEHGVDFTTADVYGWVCLGDPELAAVWPNAMYVCPTV
jgi:hypothetical protein